MDEAASSEDGRKHEILKMFVNAGPISRRYTYAKVSAAGRNGCRYWLRSDYLRRPSLPTTLL